MEMILKESDLYTGNLILVNQKHAYREKKQHTEETVCKSVFAVDANVRLKSCAADHLQCLLADIHAGHQIVPVSGWRSRQEQQQIWDDSLAEHGRVFTETYVAVPGHSEHQTGLAIDLGRMQDVIDFIRPDFPYEGICQKFRERAAAFGFVERYPKGREAVTGIGHEPWHFRYVGVPHASIMEEHGMTLEEYMDFVQQFPYGSKRYRTVCHGQIIDLSFYRADTKQGENISVHHCADTEWEEQAFRLEIDGDMPFMISGNNVDGFIITEWRRAYA